MSSQRIAVALCDDHPTFRAGLVGLLHKEQDFQVVSEAGSIAELIAQLEKVQVDVIVLDVQLPDQNGIDALESLLRKRRVLVLSAYDDPRLIRRALKSGAVGFVRKDAEPKVLLKAIRDGAAGRTVLPMEIALRLAESMRSDPDQVDLERRVRMLTGRQREVLVLLSEGRSNKEIAGSLFVSEGTVKNHVTHILSMLGVRDRTQLVAMLARYGVTP